MDPNSAPRLIPLMESIVKVFEKIKINETSIKHTIPKFKESLILEIVQSTKNVFAKETMLLQINGGFVVVGDLHGHLFDLLRDFASFGYPPSQKYLFLGDIVDRGPFSLETILLLYVLKLLYPNDIYIIRGNHEFTSLSERFGFKQEVIDTYGGPVLFNAFCDSFTQMPISAIINNEYLCVHGGIGPRLTSPEQIMSIPRPLGELYGGLADSILWSDPSDAIEVFESSTRGRGYFFGATSLRSFLKNNNLKMIIRSHQPVFDGYKYQLDNQLLTIFGASLYCNEQENLSAVVTIQPNIPEIPITFVSHPFIKRSDVIFEPFSQIINQESPQNQLPPPPPQKQHPAIVPMPRINPNKQTTDGPSTDADIDLAPRSRTLTPISSMPPPARKSLVINSKVGTPDTIKKKHLSIAKLKFG